MSSQILSATNKCPLGVSFHYKFPEKGLSLRSVVIEEDGLPKLLFDAANCRELPTLTEEDVATVARVVTDGKRPEFFYMGFDNPFHPFTNLERMYKWYYPQYLRGTSVGELLSEVDWSMKCLHVGTRSNASKTEFWSWQETSNLEDLAVHMDFPKGERTGFSVLMSCDRVEIDKSENEIFFVKEPRMKITDQTNPMYSEYITHYYDSVAYYDEPRFLKMQELMKLIVAVEWMKEKGIVFNDKWLKFHTEKKVKQSPQVEVVPVSLEEKEIESIACAMFNTQTPQLEQSMKSHQTPTKIRKTPSGIEYIRTHETNDPPVHSKTVTKVRASYNDYDFLLEGLDCNAPITLDFDGKPLKPDVRSWSELFGETVPMPIKMVAFKDRTMHRFSGGVKTRNTPKAENVERMKNYTAKNVSVKAADQIQPQTKEKTEVPKLENPTRKPPTNVSPKTIEALGNKEWTKGKIHGIQHTGGHILQTERTHSDQKKLLVSRVDKRTTNEKTETSGALIVYEKTKTTKKYSTNNGGNCHSSHLPKKTPELPVATNENQFLHSSQTDNKPSLLTNESQPLSDVMGEEQANNPLNIPENIKSNDGNPTPLSPTDSGLSSPTPEILVPPILAATGIPQYNTDGISKVKGPPSDDSGIDASIITH